MLHHLDNLRKRSHATRRNIALFSSGAITLIVFSVWWSTWSANAAVNNVAPKTAKSTKEISPTSALANTFSAGKDGIAGALSAFGERLRSISTSTPDELIDPTMDDSTEMDYQSEEAFSAPILPEDN